MALKFWQAAGLGIIAGMRSASAPAISSIILKRNNSKSLVKSPLNFMQSENAVIILSIMALGEFLADKLPGTPNRIAPSGVIFRCLSGSLSAASIFKANGKSAVKGVLLGAVLAGASTYGSYHVRKNIVAKFKISDPLIGAAEDAFVIGAGLGLATLSK